MAYIKKKWTVDTFHKGDKEFIAGLNHMEEGIAQAGGGEPSKYLKDASKSDDGNTLTITKKDGSQVVFAPTAGGGEPAKYIKDAAVSSDKLTLTKKDGSLVELDVSKKLDKPNEPVAGQGINVPYYFDVEYHESDAIVTDYTIDLLDKNKAPKQFQLRITAASEQQAGLLQAGDKIKLDRLEQVEANPTLTGEELNLTSIKIGETNYKIPEGGSGEPTEYIKQAVVDGDKLTLTKKNGSTIEFDVSNKASQDALRAEENTRSTNDQALGQLISDEASARESVDINLQTAINQEATTREQADTTLQNNINTKAELPSELPPELKVPGVDYPWFMINMNPKSIDAQGQLHLDHSGYNFNTEQYYTWSDKVIPLAATELTGGFMTAADKIKLNAAITEHQDISGKQDKLTAGNNIKIESNVISADEQLPAYPSDTSAEYILALKYENGNWVKYWKETINKSEVVDSGMVDYMVLKQ